MGSSSEGYNENLMLVPGHDEWENQHLQHPHQQFPWKLKVLHLLSGREKKK